MSISASVCCLFNLLWSRLLLKHAGSVSFQCYSFVYNFYKETPNFKKSYLTAEAQDLDKMTHVKGESAGN